MMLIVRDLKRSFLILERFASRRVDMLIDTVFCIFMGLFGVIAIEAARNARHNAQVAESARFRAEQYAAQCAGALEVIVRNQLVYPDGKVPSLAPDAESKSTIVCDPFPSEAE